MINIKYRSDLILFILVFACISCSYDPKTITQSTSSEQTIHSAKILDEQKATLEDGAETPPMDDEDINPEGGSLEIDDQFPLPDSKDIPTYSLISLYLNQAPLQEDPSSLIFTKTGSLENAPPDVKDLRGAVPHTLEWSNAGKTVTVIPDKSLDPFGIYMLTLLNFQTAGGVSMTPNPFVFEFNTALDNIENSRVLKTIPKDGERGVSLTPEICATFNVNVNREDLVFNLKHNGEEIDISAWGIKIQSLSPESHVQFCLKAPEDQPLESTSGFYANVEASSSTTNRQAISKSWGFSTNNEAPPANIPDNNAEEDGALIISTVDISPPELEPPFEGLTPADFMFNENIVVAEISGTDIPDIYKLETDGSPPAGLIIHVTPDPDEGRDFDPRIALLKLNKDEKIDPNTLPWPTTAQAIWRSNENGPGKGETKNRISLDGKEQYALLVGHAAGSKKGKYTVTLRRYPAENILRANLGKASQRVEPSITPGISPIKVYKLPLRKGQIISIETEIAQGDPAVYIYKSNADKNSYIDKDKFIKKINNFHGDRSREFGSFEAPLSSSYDIIVVQNQKLIPPTMPSPSEYTEIARYPFTVYHSKGCLESVAIKENEKISWKNDPEKPAKVFLHKAKTSTLHKITLEIENATEDLAIYYTQARCHHTGIFRYDSLIINKKDEKTWEAEWTPESSGYFNLFITDAQDTPGSLTIKELS